MTFSDKGAREVVTDWATLVDLLRWRATRQESSLGYRFLLDGESKEACLTYGELDRRARSIGALLQSLTTAGERVLLVYPPGLEFISAYFGSLYAGTIAIVVQPPHPARLGKFRSRVSGIAKDAAPSIALTTSAILKQLSESLSDTSGLGVPQWRDTDTDATGMERNWRDPGMMAPDLAFLQYTSGSTTSPRGVKVSHGNLMHNLRAIHERFWQPSDRGSVSWLPPYHDMGLIGGVLAPLHWGSPVTLMAPVAFIQRPCRWLEAISRFKGLVSGGPNFAYDLCVRKVTPEQRAQIDLSSWRVACNGAEPINARTMEEFAAHFKPCGFLPEFFKPCYGLAESTLMVSANAHTAPPVVRRVRSSELERHRVMPCTCDDDGENEVVGCGQPITKTVIVNPESLTKCPPDQIGEIWVSGPSVATGYWNHPTETEYAFEAHVADTGEGPFLRTGDLGFLLDGELYVTGRLKDLIIVDGNNHYPQDIERTAKATHKSLTSTDCAAFSVAVAGREELVVVAELRDMSRPATEDLLRAVRTAVSEQHDLRIYDIALVRVGGIPKTPSGKIRRGECRSRYLARSLDGWEPK